MNVAIVGAGISGLAAAISLRRTGHHVTLYERSSMTNEVGAAINVPPNVGRVLIPWGLDPFRSRFVTSKGMHFFNYATLQELFVHDHSETPDQWGAPLYYAHRVDLHESLKQLATDPALPGTPAIIHVNSEVVKFDAETPSIALTNGRHISSDIVVAADGVHSRAVEVVLGEPRPPQPPNTANCCFRFLVSWAELEKDLETAPFLKNQEHRARLYADREGGRRMISYPCRDNEIVNFVCIIHDPDMSSKSEDWHASVDKAELLAKFQGYHPVLLAIINKAPDVKCWPLLYRAPVPTWIKGSMALAGDAAHPLLPHKAQGGAQGIEDGIALGLALSGVTEKSQIQSRLSLYEKIRINRASSLVILSNFGYDEQMPDGIEQFLDGKPVPNSIEDQIQLAYGYDIIDDVVRIMREEVDSDFKIPDGFFVLDTL